eukprot:121768-Amphidinium_carterae.1
MPLSQNDCNYCGCNGKWNSVKVAETVDEDVYSQRNLQLKQIQVCNALATRSNSRLCQIPSHRNSLQDEFPKPPNR